jgi:hypothetical protein
MSENSSPRLVAEEVRRELPVIRSFAELVEFVAAQGDVLLRYSKGPWYDAQAGPTGVIRLC